MNLPQTQEYPAAYSNYINIVEGDVIEVLEKQITDLPNFLNNNADKGEYAYAPGKWTIKEVIGHIIDVERIMAYRLTCFARNETIKIPGFEEDNYVANAHFNDRSVFSLAEEFSQLRKANMFLIKSLNETDLNRIGNANDNNMSVRALVFVLAGHVKHHVNVINERYL